LQYDIKKDSLKHDFKSLGMDSWIIGLTFTLDSKSAIIGFQNGFLIQLNIKKSAILKNFGKIHIVGIWSIKISSDNKYLYTSAQDKSVKIFRIKDQSLYYDFGRIHDAAIRSICFC